MIAHKARHQAKGHGFGYEIRSLDDVQVLLLVGVWAKKGIL